MMIATTRLYLSRTMYLSLAAQLMALAFSTPADATLSSCSVPIVEYKFNETGANAPSTGTDLTAVAFKNSDGVETDLHGAAGSGVSGQAGDRAFDNSNPSTPSGGGLVGLGGFGGRAEQPGDDGNVDALTSFTLQGWFKGNDPASVTGNAGRLFDKNDAYLPPDGGGYFLGWNAGIINLQVKAIPPSADSVAPHPVHRTTPETSGSSLP